MTRRFSSSTLTGMLRTDVAVGTVSDDSMLATIFDAAPRNATGVPEDAGGAGTGVGRAGTGAGAAGAGEDRKSTRLNSSHSQISYAVFCLKKKIKYYIIYAVGWTIV